MNCFELVVDVETSLMGYNYVWLNQGMGLQSISLG